MRYVLISGILLLNLGCSSSDGGGSDGPSAEAAAYHGVYATQERKATSTGCDETTFVEASDSDFRYANFKLDEFTLLDHYSPVTLYDCTSADVCTDTIAATYVFNVYADDQWTISDDWTPMSSSMSKAQSNCSFSFSRVVLGKGTDDSTIEIRNEVHLGSVPHPEGDTDCNMDKLYAANKDTLACTKVIRVKAQKVKGL